MQMPTCRGVYLTDCLCCADSWDGEVGNPYQTCGGVFHYLGCGGDETGIHRPYANPYPSDLLVFSSGMHDDRPGHTS